MFRPGDHVRIPEGDVVQVLDGDVHGLVKVQLDGEAMGLYPPELLVAAPPKGEEG